MNMFHPTPKEMGRSKEEMWSRARKPSTPFLLSRVIPFLAILAFSLLYAYQYVMREEIATFTSWFGLVLFFAMIEVVLADHFGPYKRKTRQASILYGFFLAGGIFTGLVGHLGVPLAAVILASATIFLGVAIIVRGFHLFDPHP